MLHEREIRRRFGPFHTLGSEERHREFEDRLRATIEAAPFHILSTTIDKRTLLDRPAGESRLDPYTICFVAALVALQTEHLPDIAAAWPPPELIVETRGRYEDLKLEAVFAQLRSDDSPAPQPIQFALRFAGKQQNHTGLEIADLVANPISRHVLGLNQPLIPCGLLRTKFFGDLDPQSGPDGFPRSQIVVQAT